ncbi:hypothetical protein DFP74_2234 [Nocardiopsis sp. Huas11]|nr:hypothetical protein DFP74_2234 [Nocardiopsis sp. Huas11]
MAPDRSPILLLGTSERVGSNWTMDALRHATIQHNEPLRQQLGLEHPYSPLSSAPSDHTIAVHWLKAFVRGKHQGGPHVIKETNLYFTTDRFLRLFPESPVLVLSRSPLGVASSFNRGDLWRRWRYGDIYRRIAAMTHDPARNQWARLVPDDSPVAPVALTRLIALNTGLLAEALSEREHAHISYESAVLDRDAAMSPVMRLVPEARRTVSPGFEANQPVVDGTFATNRTKHELVVGLSPGDVELVNAETERNAVLLRDLLTPPVADRATRWLAGADRYRRADPPTRGSRSPRTPVPLLTSPPSPTYVTATSDELRWRNVLVTNAEMCGLLNGLAAAGLDNTTAGVHLLAIVMPHERGGRLHSAKEGWRVSPGFDHHPAYWVTWIGAAAYALSEGARLPTREEMDILTEGVQASNAAYSVGDATPVAEPGSGADAVHHRVGNLQVWCADGPGSEPSWAPVTRYLHGAAWNTPSSREEVSRARSRHLLGASRGVGVRLVRDRTTGPGLPLEEIADRLRTWMDGLGRTDRCLSEHDQQVISVLSQSDR